MNRKDEILKLFPKELRALLGQVPAEFEDIQEIRLRAGQPVILVCKNREYMVGQGGELPDQYCRAGISCGRSLFSGTVRGQG